jgi:hypothetical protein
VNAKVTDQKAVTAVCLLSSWAAVHHQKRIWSKGGLTTKVQGCGVAITTLEALVQTSAASEISAFDL